MTRNKKFLLNYFSQAIAFGKENRLTVEKDDDGILCCRSSNGAVHFNYPDDRSWVNLSFSIEYIAGQFAIDEHDAMKTMKAHFEDNNTTVDHYIGGCGNITIKNLSPFKTMMSTIN